MVLKIKIAQKIPLQFLNNLLLSLPFLYKTKFINYESYLDEFSNKELLDCMNKLKDLPGNIIECGCARCGTTSILGNYLKENQIDKKIFALDSFSGFDEKELSEERQSGLTNSTSKDFTYSSYDYVMKKIKKLELSEKIMPIEGYFEDTLPNLDSNFCMGFIDCDLSKSISFVTENIWSRLTPGGQLFFDDYGNTEFKGVKIAVDDFIKIHLKEIEEHGKSHRLYYIKKQRL